MQKYAAPRLMILIAIFTLVSCGSDDNGGSTDNMAPVNPDCVDSDGISYPCLGFSLTGRVSLAEMGASMGNDIWGWTDSETGREYALMGLNNGTAFVDVSGTSPQYLGKLNTASSSSLWRDIKVNGDYAYIVSEATAHGIQVFDLKKLRDTQGIPKQFSADTTSDLVGKAHNIVINPRSDFVYPVGTTQPSRFAGGVQIVDVSDPINPVQVGGYSSAGYTHDAQVVTYAGPDTDHLGEELFIGSNESFIVIVNISDTSNPIEIGRFAYGNIGYTHQGWLSDDHRYFFLGDEADEFNFGFNSRTLIFDLADLDNPVLHTTYLGETAAIDHNGYVNGDYFYLANYTAGLRLIDISNIESKELVEVGFFDTCPDNDATNTNNGAWSVYPYFASGKIVISDINSGMFIVQRSE